jgi:hypothetical protein
MIKIGFSATLPWRDREYSGNSPFHAERNPHSEQMSLELRIANTHGAATYRGLTCTLRHLMGPPAY